MARSGGREETKRITVILEDVPFFCSPAWVLAQSS